MATTTGSTPPAPPTVTPYSLLDRLTEFSSAEGALLVALAPVVHAWLPANVWTSLIPIVMAAAGAAKVMYPSNPTVQTIVTDVDTLAGALKGLPAPAGAPVGLTATGIGSSVAKGTP